MEYNPYNKLFVGKVFIILDNVESTNNEALKLIKEENPADGTVVFTRDQQKGRGQFGNRWESDPDANITMSIIFYPDFLRADESFLLNQAISLGLKNFIEEYILNDIKIKWPNDINHSTSKIAGILIENTIRGEMITSSVVGIGVNINQIVFASKNFPTSFKKITGDTYDVIKLAKELCSFIEVKYLELRNVGNQKIEKEYLRSLFQYHEEHSYKTQKGVIKGKIQGISKEGKLILESRGEQLTFGFKEIEFVL